MPYINVSSIVQTRFLLQSSRLPCKFGISFTPHAKPRLQLFSGPRPYSSSPLSAPEIAGMITGGVYSASPHASCGVLGFRATTSYPGTAKSMVFRRIFDHHLHSSVNNVGSEKGETYPKDAKNSVLKSLARAGYHEMFEDIRKRFFADAKEELVSAGILGADRSYYKKGREVIRQLLVKGFISEHDYFKIVGKNVGMSMLDGNVFALDLDCRVISFRSRSAAMREYCRQKLVKWV